MKTIANLQRGTAPIAHIYQDVQVAKELLIEIRAHGSLPRSEVMHQSRDACRK
jgi:hypothetical protein